MSQKLSAVIQAFGINDESLSRFRETLSVENQQVLDDLLYSIQIYRPAVSVAGQVLPMELVLLTMLMEHHKMVQFLIGQLNYYDQKLYLTRVKQLSD